MRSAAAGRTYGREMSGALFGHHDLARDHRSFVDDHTRGSDIATDASARQDLESVSDLARRMVLDFAMSELGVIAAPGREGGALSHDVAKDVDREAMRLIEQAFATARAILGERRDKLVEISEHLKQVETITGEQLDALLGPEWELFPLN